MTDIIKAIAEQYPHLSAERQPRNKAFGVIINNTEVGGVLLAKHPAGKRVAEQVLQALGHKAYEGFDNTPKRIVGSLDDF